MTLPLISHDCSRLLPVKCESWPSENGLKILSNCYKDDIESEIVQSYTSGKLWVWTGKRQFFFTDLHADADAFFLSLIGSGGVEKYGSTDDDFRLTDEGKEATFIIGGDCFDKGPDNLRLLDVISSLIRMGADVEILAGNHDLRTYLGIYYAENKSTLLDHLFVRMGKKTVPLLKEIHNRYSHDAGYHSQKELTSIHEALFPEVSWYAEFPRIASKWVKLSKLEKEIRRIQEKTEEFEESANKLGMDMADILSAVKKFRQIFFEPEGKYFWFFNRMKIAHLEGSYLFVHAGVDDDVAKILSDEGCEGLNNRFKEMLRSNPFELYHGVLGNVFRTKYREFDYPLSEIGVKVLHDNGIYAIAHGHRNILRGQRIVMRAGMLNFECDASVDCNTRVIEGLNGPGGAVVCFHPNGEVRAVSTDYPYIKLFKPDRITIAAEGQY